MATLLENMGRYEKAIPFYTEAKNIDISSAVGLESVHRLKAIYSFMRQQEKREELSQAKADSTKKHKKSKHDKKKD